MDGGGLFDQTGRDVNGDGYRDGYGYLGFEAALVAVLEVLGLPAAGLGAVAAAADLGAVAEAEAGLAEDLGAAVSEEVVVVPRRKEEAEDEDDPEERSRGYSKV